MNPPASEYQSRIEARPDFCFLSVRLNPGQSIKVESSAMATMDTNLSMKTTMRGGLGRFLTGEAVFVNEFTAQNGPGEIGVAPGAPGDMDHIVLRDGEFVFLQNAAYVASSPSVQLDSQWQGVLKGFFSGESLFLIKCTGPGDLWFNTYGGMIPLDVEGECTVDTGHIVAFTSSLQYSVGRIGGYKSLFFSGEGLVCHFRGTGRLWIQTHKIGAFARWILPFRPQAS